MSFFRMTATLAVVGLVAACAQQEEPILIAPEPVFNKFGDVSSGECVEGYIYVPGAVPEPICIPEDECEEYVDATGQPIECPPPPRRDPQFPDDDDDDRPTPGRPSNPTGGPVGTAPIN